MKVRSKYTFKVNLGFGNVYEFFEGGVAEVKDSDAGYIFEKFPGMLEKLDESASPSNSEMTNENVAATGDENSVVASDSEVGSKKSKRSKK
jgi:hypothetical protein